MLSFLSTPGSPEALATGGRVQQGQNRRKLGDWLMLLLLLAFALAASSQRIVAAPGFEFYLGPFFYLIAYRVYGLRVGLAIAGAVMLPTYLWWGHAYSIFIAMANVGLIHLIRHRVRSLGLGTLIFHVTIGAAANWAVLHFALDAPQAIMLLTGTRKTLNDIGLAALVDLVCALIAIRDKNFRLVARRSVSLGTLTLAIMIVAAVGTATTVLIADVRDFEPRLADFKRDITQSVMIRTLELHSQALPIPERIVVGDDADDPHLIFISRDPKNVDTVAIRKTLQCLRVDGGRTTAGTNNRNTFTYWLSTCYMDSITVAGQRFWIVLSTREYAIRSYEQIARKVMIILPILLISVLATILLTSSLSKSLMVWRNTVRRFGTPNLAMPAHVAIQELVQPIASFVKANNEFMTLVSQRRIVIQAMSELSAAISLRLIADIAFDATSGDLSFAELRFDRDAIPVHLFVNPADRIELTNAAGSENLSIEIRVNCDGEEHWHLLMARECVGGTSWKSGCMMRLQQPKFAQDRMLQQARLIELGGMASALSHELKQPLFTIALAAENGSFQLDKNHEGGAAKALGKFQRIIEQVERARAIIGRISRYARIEAPPNEVFDLLDGIATATIFLRPLLISEGVEVRIVNGTNGPVFVTMPRVGLEQLIVNALQNAVDAIGTRREVEPVGFAGIVEISCNHDEDGVTVSIADNGTGLASADPERLFDAFMTTKAVDKGTGLGLYISRQILLEIGGTISIASRPEPGRGAIVTIVFAPTVLSRGGQHPISETLELSA